MSILINVNGIEMPNNCFCCPMRSGTWCHAQGKWLCDFDSAEEMREKRDASCPLIPIPPHGDLIDRDATMGKIGYLADKIDKELGYEKSAPYIMMSLYLNNADDFPTIIPAEEGE